VTEPAIRLHAVGHAYRPGQWIFRDCTAALERGRVLAVLGPNGAGKTTLLRLMLGIGAPREGSIERTGRVAFVPQLFQVGFDYSVLDMVLMGRARRVGLFAQPGRDDEAAALAALDRLGLAALARRPFHDLSGGQRQLVILARAEVAEADLLILDEPASALDLGNQAVILDHIARLRHDDGRTVIFTTHHPHHALAVADSVLLMRGAEAPLFGPADAVLCEETLSALYRVPIRRVSVPAEGGAIETLVPVLHPPLRPGPGGGPPPSTTARRPDR